jgi:WD40 repeat protein
MAVIAQTGDVAENHETGLTLDPLRVRDSSLDWVVQPQQEDDNAANQFFLEPLSASTDFTDQDLLNALQESLGSSGLLEELANEDIAETDIEPLSPVGPMEWLPPLDKDTNDVSEFLSGNFDQTLNYSNQEPQANEPFVLPYRDPLQDWDIDEEDDLYVDEDIANIFNSDDEQSQDDRIPLQDEAHDFDLLSQLVGELNLVSVAGGDMDDFESAIVSNMLTSMNTDEADDSMDMKGAESSNDANIDPSLMFCQPCDENATSFDSEAPDEATFADRISHFQSESTSEFSILPPEEELKHMSRDDLERLLLRTYYQPRSADSDRGARQAADFDSPNPIDEFDEVVVPADDEEEPSEKVHVKLDSSRSQGEELDSRTARPEALQSARPFLEAFGVDAAGSIGKDTTASLTTPTNKRPKPPKNERMCIGHKERIMGLDVSECGKYLATASQDSTVRIWRTLDGKPLATLTDHSVEYECLRVAWASAQWENEHLRRPLTMNDNALAQQATRHSSSRYLLASAGADGTVRLWGCTHPDHDEHDKPATESSPIDEKAHDSNTLNPTSWQCLCVLDHATFNHFTPQDDTDKPQIYSLQFVDHWFGLPTAAEEKTDEAGSNSFLLTSSDDHVHLWEVDQSQKRSKGEDGKGEAKVHLCEVFSIRFGSLHETGYGIRLGQVTGNRERSTASESEGASSEKKIEDVGFRFGGERNPHNLVYVFDSAYSSTNGLLGVALSDGSLRLLNGRGVCLSVLQLPGVESHLTSFGWDSTGERLATCVGTGQLVTWRIAHNTSTPGGPHIQQQRLQPSCTAVLSGGHEPGRPLFGAMYLGETEELLLTWGYDGRVCLWDATRETEIEAPLATLLCKDDYPIFAAAKSQHSGSPSAEKAPDVLAVAGGSTAGFLGVPVYLYDLPAL